MSLDKTKRNKFVGPNEIAIEKMSTLDDLGIDKTNERKSELYDSGEILEDPSRVAKDPKCR